MEPFYADDEFTHVVAYGYKFDTTDPENVVTVPANLSVRGAAIAPGETGLGIFEVAGGLIDGAHFVQFDMADVIRTRENNCSEPALTICKLEAKKGYEIWGSNTLGEQGESLFQYVNNDSADEICQTICIPTLDKSRDTLIKYGAAVPFRYISVSPLIEDSETDAGAILVKSVSAFHCKIQPKEEDEDCNC